ncbi:hypothetical protein H310_03519 [Aphanomyces invadans]|uniref:Transmembrane protein n=1 Tax=Aphanomyces invadans TaxID=157072 RepID=A0A024UHH6_9STRA|nr:hypothetical protein H310_03519 [Aphanomyces invadans]ETW05861.1 hypothetical protein H310_03519 [Aphanomyces invadans]|eukprot:XP_008865638.1 hypothetical protein H310_03519 [Aphanomyces invadans]
MNPSRLNVLTKRHNEAHAARLQNQYSSSRGAMGFLLMVLLLVVLPHLTASISSTVLSFVFVFLPGYSVALISGLVAVKAAYIAVIYQWSLFSTPTDSANSSSTKRTESGAAAQADNGLRQRKFVVPEVVGEMSPIETLRVDGKLSNPPIISTEAELIPYQPQATSNGDDDFGEAAKLNFGFGMEMSSAINPNGLYAHTYAVMKPSAKPPVRKELESALSSAPHVDKAHEVLAECRMKSHHMGNLCDTLRHVLAQHLQDVLGTLAQNMDELSKLGLRREILVDLSTVHPMLSIQVPGEPTPRTISNLSMKSLINMARTEPAFASRARQNVHLLREYETLMKYFDVKEEYSSAYAIQRLQTLGEDGFLGPYRWDSGGKWKGKPWTKDSMLPSDAELIMNLFCAMLDDVLPATCDTDRPFRRTHYAPSPPTKSASIRGMFLIFCSQVSPPNFKVIANGAVWEILPGKTNVFQAIVLFLHAVKTYKSGHLGNINLHVLLEEIFDK